MPDMLTGTPRSHSISASIQYVSFITSLSGYKAVRRASIGQCMKLTAGVQGAGRSHRTCDDLSSELHYRSLQRSGTVGSGRARRTNTDVTRCRLGSPRPTWISRNMAGGGVVDSYSSKSGTRLCTEVLTEVDGSLWPKSREGHTRPREIPSPQTAHQRGTASVAVA
ncbi:hypothetical protein OH76DRAFT_177402 [Lentinus brumalis]|uniref:Uncharacterized protein n=1 Tax=Lentinus brumalis TaxID=2498619 RepID=A0A371CNK5_9APHY|nr:hypothetical protein OH76DRAFT_177402 [Polyporus brumalis]